MFSEKLKNKYEFLTNYFEQGLKGEKRSLAHSILLYGDDIEAQYEFATEIAKLLNCKQDKNYSCSCLNCNWIKDKKHPAILTISKLDNKPSDDTSKTVISIKQSQMVKNLLMNTSEYHRVFIFCDAKMEKTQDGEIWTPLGLNSLNFQEETANSLLKIIEEPPQNTTFFFLTRDKNDLLETIISRSQSFFVPAFDIKENKFDTVEEIFADYPNIDRSSAFDVALKLFSVAKDKGDANVLAESQNYLSAILKSNLDNTELRFKIMKDIKLIEQTQKMINSHINPQLAFEEMMLNITAN